MGDNAPMNTTTKAQDRALRALVSDTLDVTHTRLLPNGELVTYHADGSRHLIERSGLRHRLDGAAA